ncbi:MAG: hypothetical protein QM503_11710 [Bacteroidota bacterium]
MAEHSRAQAVMIADIIIQKPALLDELLKIIFEEEEPVSRRAAWPLRFILERDKRLMDNYIPIIITKLPEIKSVAIQRNLLFILANSNIPNFFFGRLLEFTSKILLDTSSSVASLIYSIDIFFDTSKNEPDLLNELRLMIELLLPNATAGVRSKCRKTLKKIDRLDMRIIK